MKKIISIILVLVLAAGAGFGIYYWLNKKNKSSYSVEISAPTDGAIELTVAGKQYKIDSNKTENYSFEKNAKLVLRATAKEGFAFSYWQIGKEKSSSNPKTHILVEDTKINVVFEVLNKTINVVDEEENPIKSFGFHGSGLYQKLQSEVIAANGYYYTFSLNNQPITSESNINVIQDLTIVATKHVQDYALNYVLTGGTVATANPTSYNIESAEFTLNNPTKPGYNFAGWTGTGLSEATETVTVATGSTGARTYTATWSQISYGIGYNLNGGTVATPNPSSYTIETEDFTLTNPTKPGYTFAGWTSESFGGTLQTVSILKGSTGARAYTATWAVEDYNIIYDLAGGTVATANPTSYNIESAEFTLNNPTKPGYNFAGWTGTGLSEATETVTVATGSTGARTYTATWSLKQYTVNFKDGEDVLKTETCTIETEKPKADDIAGFVVEWKVGDTAWEDYDISSSESLTIVVIAHKKVAYTVTLNEVGELELDTYKQYNKENGTITFVYVEGDESITLPTPTRTGYEFLYWSNGSNDLSTPISSIDTSILSNQSLIAIWSKQLNVSYVGYENESMPTQFRVGSDGNVYKRSFGTTKFDKTVEDFVKFLNGLDTSTNKSIVGFKATNSGGTVVYEQNGMEVDRQVVACFNKLFENESTSNPLNLTLTFSAI